MIIYRATVNTGSFKFAKVAEEKNSDNLLVIIREPGLIKRYLANVAENLGHSERYGGGR
jgi:hypothetical protein